MSNPTMQLQEATIKAQCKTLRMPMDIDDARTCIRQLLRFNPDFFPAKQMLVEFSAAPPACHL